VILVGKEYAVSDALTATQQGDMYRIINILRKTKDKVNQYFKLK
jgi:hypothetical protein